jgi:hypothetical protein
LHVTSWTSDALDRIGSADELRITSARADGTLRPYVPIWVVPVGHDVYVRSYRRSGSRLVDPTTGAAVRATTLRLAPH